MTENASCEKKSSNLLCRSRWEPLKRLTRLLLHQKHSWLNGLWPFKNIHTWVRHIYNAPLEATNVLCKTFCALPRLKSLGPTSLCHISITERKRQAKWDAAGAPLVSRQRSRTTSHSAARCVTHLLDVKNENIDGCNLQGSGVAEETGWLNGRDVAKRCVFATAAAAVIDTVISIAVEQQVG